MILDRMREWDPRANLLVNCWFSGVGPQKPIPLSVQVCLPTHLRIAHSGGELTRN